MRRTGADAEGRTDSGLGPRGAAGSTGGSRHMDGPAHLLHAVRRFFLLAMNAVAASKTGTARGRRWWGSVGAGGGKGSPLRRAEVMECDAVGSTSPAPDGAPSRVRRRLGDCLRPASPPEPCTGARAGAGLPRASHQPGSAQTAAGRERLRRRRRPARPLAATAGRTAAGLLVALAALCGLAALSAGAAQAQTTLVSNTGETAQAGRSNLVFAQSFRTGDNETGYTLSTVELFLLAATRGTGVVKIFSDSAGAPGSAVATLTNPATFTVSALNTFTAPPDTVLAENTTYWLMVNEGVANVHNRLFVGSTHSDDETSAASGWRIGDSRLWKSTAASAWSTSNAALRFAVNGRARTAVSIEAEEGPVVAGAWDAADFTLTRRGDTTGALTVTVETTQTSDYANVGTKSVTFDAGKSTARLRLHLFRSGSSDGSITATVQAGTGYVPGTPASATLAVLRIFPVMDIFIEDETATVDEGGSLAVEVVARTVAGAPRPGGDFGITVVFSTRTISGGASSPADLDHINREFRIAPGDFSQESGRWVARTTLRVPTKQDIEYEDDETFGVTLDRSAFLRGAFTIVRGTDYPWDGGGDGLLVTITDDDAPRITSIEFTSDPGDDETYILGDTITARVTFSDPVDVSGAPFVFFTFDEVLFTPDLHREARCGTGTNVTTIDCTWQIDKAITDTTGVSTTHGLGLPHGASVKATGTDLDANLAYPGVGDQSGHKVDSIPPAIVDARASADRTKIVLAMTSRWAPRCRAGRAGSR